MIKPMGNRLLVLQDKAPEEVKTPSGIYMPATSIQRPLRGTVKSVGPKVEFIKEGDTVCFARFAGQNLQDGADSYLVMAESEIICQLA